MYAALRREEPGLGSIMGLNLAAVRPTEFELTNRSFRAVTRVKAQLAAQACRQVTTVLLV
jgi:hypothetical protein